MSQSAYDSKMWIKTGKLQQGSYIYLVGFGGVILGQLWQSHTWSALAEL